MSKKRKINRIRQWAVSRWTSSFAYKLIDECISKSYRRRLKNDEFTILCSNCIGGVIYHRLGKRFLSPTINLYFSQPDFAYFCIYLDHYLKEELTFIESEFDHPVGILKGNGNGAPTITIYFNHDKTEDAARENWNKRKKRIRTDNLYIILYKLDGITIEQLYQLEQIPCKNMVVFTSTPLPEIAWSCYIKPNLRHKYPYNYLQKDLFGVRYFERKFDVVSFLNNEKTE